MNNKYSVIKDIVVWIIMSIIGTIIFVNTTNISKISAIIISIIATVIILIAIYKKHTNFIRKYSGNRNWQFFYGEQDSGGGKIHLYKNSGR